MSIRPVRRMIEAQPTVEGAGVKLRRAFGFGETDDTDPFLLFDDFRNDDPNDYRAGFPWHSHRGILHQEMSQGDAPGHMHGFPLRANLPSSLKLTMPRYQDVGARATSPTSPTTHAACSSSSPVLSKS